MARPRIDDDAKRLAPVGVRFTASELDQLARDAARSGLDLSAYIRRVCLSRRVVVHQTRRLDWPAFDQLRRIGVNLNQALRLAHATGRIPAELVSAAAAVEGFLSREIEGHGPEGRG